jgi:hypothetical protein
LQFRKARNKTLLFLPPRTPIGFGFPAAAGQFHETGKSDSLGCIHDGWRGRFKKLESLILNQDFPLNLN